MERRPDRISLSERLEDLDGFRTPEIHRQVRRELVPEEDGPLGGRLLQVIERLDPSAKKYTHGSDWQKVEEGGERRGLAGMRLFRCDKDRSVRLKIIPHRAAVRASMFRAR